MRTSDQSSRHRGRESGGGDRYPPDDDFRRFTADPRRTDRLDFVSFTMYSVHGRDTSRAAGAEAEDYPPGVYVEWRDGFFVGVNYSSRPFAVPVKPGAKVILGSNPLRPADILIWKE